MIHHSQMGDYIPIPPPQIPVPTDLSNHSMPSQHHYLHTFEPSSMRVHVLRMLPGEDLVQSLSNFMIERHIGAAVILTCVGSTSTTTLRPAGEANPIVLEGKYGAPA